VVVRGGYVVFEAYYDGASPESYHSVNSVTKSVVSMLVGIALRDGLLSSVEQPIFELISEYDTTDLDPRKRSLTVRHLLTMTSGFEHIRAELLIPLDSDDIVRSVLARPLAHPPGARFQYEDASVQLLSVILTRLTGLSLAAYAVRELFGPLGIWPDERSRSIWRAEPGAGHTLHFQGHWPEDGLAWRTDQHGHSIAGFGLHVTAREMAKLGYLYLNGGCWAGRQIVPAEFVRDSTREQSAGGPPAGSPYGYLWWLGPNGSYAASGFGGQGIQVSPARDLVVAFATRQPRNSADRILRRFLLPAITT
jgi:CubicO group peptidase (beta-lactamase class C family)